MLRRYWSIVLIILLIAFGLASRWPKWESALQINLAEREVLTAPLCDPTWYLCANLSWTNWYPPYAWSGNQAVLIHVNDHLQEAIQIDPDNVRAQLHRAEMLFASGSRAEAAAVLQEHGYSLISPAADESTYRPNSTTDTPARPSSLLVKGRYEYYLLQGHQYFAQQNYADAANSFSLAMAFAGERALPQDRRAFYEATGRWHAQTAANVRQSYLAGKYFTLAGLWDESLKYLLTLTTDTRLSKADQARAAYYSGRAYEGLGKPAQALERYQLGWQIEPQIRANGMRLVDLLRANNQSIESENIALRLKALGPEYPVDKRAMPLSTPSGLVFAGYDVDPDLVSWSAPLEMWLWWQTSDIHNIEPMLHDSTVVGEHLVQHQWVTNAALNPSFEWGAQADGTPLNWAWRIYSEEPDSLYITTTERDGQSSHVAVASNAHRESSGLTSLLIPVEPNGWYLMAGWIKQHDAPNSHIGRVCIGPDFSARGPYITRSQPQTFIQDNWVHITDLAPAFPKEQPEQCRLQLINFQNPSGATMWDDIILARVTLP